MKMKKTLLIAVLALILTLSVGVFSVFAEESTAGSDLPVSESYVLRVISALEERIYEKIDTMVEGLNTRIDALAAAPAPAETEAAAAETVTPAQPQPITDYEVVYLTRGQTIVGSSEFILRSGSAVSTCPGINGITDITDGIDLTDGMEIPWNHLLLVPRDDGRGITVTSNEAYVMARGQYTVLSPEAEAETEAETEAQP